MGYGGFTISSSKGRDHRTQSQEPRCGAAINDAIRYGASPLHYRDTRQFPAISGDFPSVDLGAQHRGTAFPGKKGRFRLHTPYFERVAADLTESSLGCKLDQVLFLHANTKWPPLSLSMPNEGIGYV